MQLVWKFVDDLWNIRWVKGHRTTIAQYGLMATAMLMAYQGAATSADLIAAGVNFPDLPPEALLWVSAAAAYLAKKVRQFAMEHQPPAP